jgi:DNA-directed RNA polymerase subunit alpha
MASLYSTNDFDIKVLSYQQEKDNKISSEIQIGPLKKNMGITLGNAIRRTLYINLEGVAITSVHLYNTNKNVDSLHALREDIFELALNLQGVILSSNKLPFQGTALIEKSGPGIITAADISLPAGIKVINSRHYIGCINQDCSITMSLDINSGTGYNNYTSTLIQPTKLNINNLFNDQFDSNLKNQDYDKPLKLEKAESLSVDSMKVDGIFTPIVLCNFNVELKPNQNGEKSVNNKNLEYINLYITTNGSLSPHQAIVKSCNDLIDLLKIIKDVQIDNFNELKNHDDSNFLNFSSTSNDVVRSKKVTTTLTHKKTNSIENIDNTEFLNSPIEKLNLSKRVLNSLKRANYNTIGDLIYSSKERFKNIKNFGKKSMVELKNSLDQVIQKDNGSLEL